MLLLAGLAAWGFWPRRSPPPAPPQTAGDSPLHSKMESLSLIEVENGGKRWALEAQSAEYLKDREEIRVKDIHLEFFGEGQRKLRLSCQEGLINPKTKTLVLKGEVVLQDGELTIRSPLVHYEPKERVLVAPEEAILESPRVRIQGKGLRVELSAKRLALAQHRFTEVKVEGREWPR